MNDLSELHAEILGDGTYDPFDRFRRPLRQALESRNLSLQHRLQMRDAEPLLDRLRIVAVGKVHVFEEEADEIGHF